jgi:hypothetical protein
MSKYIFYLLIGNFEVSGAKLGKNNDIANKDKLYIRQAF